MSIINLSSCFCVVFGGWGVTQTGMDVMTKNIPYPNNLSFTFHSLCLFFFIPFFLLFFFFPFFYFSFLCCFFFFISLSVLPSQVFFFFFFFFHFPPCFSFCVIFIYLFIFSFLNSASSLFISARSTQDDSALISRSENISLYFFLLANLSTSFFPQSVTNHLSSIKKYYKTSHKGE